MDPVLDKNRTALGLNELCPLYRKQLAIFVSSKDSEISEPIIILSV